MFREMITKLFIKRASLLVFILLGFALSASGQITFQTDMLTASRFTDEAGKHLGSGAMQRVAATCTMPWGVKADGCGRQCRWAVTLRAGYAWLDNRGVAKSYNPNRVLQAGANLSHVRSLSPRWQLMASLGAGFYADPREVDWGSLLANGGIVFAYRINPHLSLGAGLGLTNSYGVPLLLPLGYFNYNGGERFRLTIDLATRPKVSVATRPARWLTLELTPFEIDGLTAVRRINGKSKVYSSTLLQSAFRSTFHLRESLSLHVEAAGTWRRSVRLTDKSLRGLKSQLSDGEEKRYFLPALQLSAGLSLAL